MAAFDRIAKTSERARDRLREDAEVDEIPVNGVPHHPERREEQRVERREHPRKAITHGACGAAADTARRTRRCRRRARLARFPFRRSCGDLSPAGTAGARRSESATPTRWPGAR